MTINFGARRILSVYLKTELNSVFGGGVGTCLTVKVLKAWLFTHHLASSRYEVDFAQEKNVGEMMESKTLN